MAPQDPNGPGHHCDTEIRIQQLINAVLAEADRHECLRLLEDVHRRIPDPTTLLPTLRLLNYPDHVIRTELADIMSAADLAYAIHSKLKEVHKIVQKFGQELAVDNDGSNVKTKAHTTATTTPKRKREETGAQLEPWIETLASTKKARSTPYRLSQSALRSPATVPKSPYQASVADAEDEPTPERESAATTTPTTTASAKRPVARTASTLKLRKYIKRGDQEHEFDTTNVIRRGDKFFLRTVTGNLEPFELNEVKTTEIASS